MFNDNENFYPTPQEITYKLLDKLYNDTTSGKEFYNCKYILEPEAGSGSIIEAFHNYYVDKQVELYDRINSKLTDKRRQKYYNKNELLKDSKNKFKFDCIEIDERLNNILRGKNYNVVWDDYLTFFPPKFYDLIIQNVPFSNGVHHVLKSIEIQERIGGKILAIINSETIKNPYSKERKQLINKLKEYKADIEYIQNAFSNAERKTNVGVALLYIKVPMKNTESLFEKEFKRSHHVEINNINDFNALIPKMNKLQQLVFEYKTCRDAIIKLYEERERINKLFNGLNIQQQIGIIDDCTAQRTHLSVNDFIANINLKYWNKFITETDFKSKLPTKLRDTFDYNMERQKDIEFNIENVQYFYETLIMAIPKTYEESVYKTFSDLTNRYNYSESSFNTNIHYYSGWKTNKICKIVGKNIIPIYRDSLYRLPDILHDLNIIFQNLSGIKDNIETPELLNRIKNCEKNIETKFFILNSYQRTLHIKYKDKELLKKFNYIACKGSNQLPPNFEKKHYKDMTKEEKELVTFFGFDPFEFDELVSKNNNSYIPLQLN